MKRLLCMSIIAGLFFSCTSITVKETQNYSTGEDVSITLDAYSYNLQRVKKDKSQFVPIKKNQKILEAHFTFNNSGSLPFEPLDDSVIELVCVSPSGSISFSPAEDPFAIHFAPVTYKAVREKKSVDQYSEGQRAYCFVYEKNLKPSFISVNRTSFIDLYLIKDTSLILETLHHHAQVEKLVKAASFMNYDEIAGVMEKSGVTVDETDSKNWTMLISAIASHNNNLFDSLVLHGADIFKETIIQGYSITPIHAAVLACNAHAADFLLSKGAVLEDLSGNSPASLAVKTQNIESLEFLKNRGYDFSQLKIRDDVFIDKFFTPQIYAKRNSYNEVEDFFASLSN